MSFDIFEKSNRAGKPIFLFRFTSGTVAYTYTSDDQPHTYLDESYIPLEGLEPSGTAQSQEINAQRITIKASKEWIIPRQYVAFVPALQTFLVVYKFHRADPADVYVYWQGFVQSAKFDDKNSYLNCSPITVLFDRLGLRRTFSALCGHILYDGFCPVPASAFRIDGTLSAPPSGFTLTAPEWAAQPDQWFKSGFIERVLDSGVTDMRLITANVAGVLTLLSPFPSDVVAGEVLRAYAGCDHLFSTCAGKFGAYTDTGGACGCFDRIPKKNPFQTGIKNVG